MWGCYPKRPGTCALQQGSPGQPSPHQEGPRVGWKVVARESSPAGPGPQAVDITDLSKTQEQSKRFTFIRSDSGPTTSFESAACPGWFLCTQLEADRPVSLTNTPGEAIIVTKFYFQQD